MAEVATPEQIAEYESQLEGIEQLLADSPEDESLLTLKKDLVELLQLTKANEPTTTAAPADSSDLGEAPQASLASETPVENAGVPSQLAEDAAPVSAANTDAAEAPAASAANAPTKKKSTKKLKDFVVPPHLIVNEQDTEAEQKKKRRALKALKSQWRERKKEVESELKQKSWQSFQKKKRSKSSADGSIFATQDSVNDRVGVISKKTKTEFGERKRHKHL